MSVFVTTIITDLRGLARQARELAYTGAYDKEHELLGLANKLNQQVERLETFIGPLPTPMLHRAGVADEV